MEADRLFRRGCLQYLEDFGLKNKTRHHFNAKFSLTNYPNYFYGSMPSPVP